VKFCRRVGERKETPRPLIVGFKSEAARNTLLESARRLEDTVFKDVSVAPRPHEEPAGGGGDHEKGNGEEK